MPPRRPVHPGRRGGYPSGRSETKASPRLLRWGGQGVFKPFTVLDDKCERPVAVGLTPEPVKIVEAPVFKRRDCRYRGFAKPPLFGGWPHEFESVEGFGFTLLRIRIRV